MNWRDGCTNRQGRFTLEFRPWQSVCQRVISCSSTFNIKMSKFSKIHYSPKCLWKGLKAVKKLVQVAGVCEGAAKLWLMKQPIWQIYLPAPKNILGQKFLVTYPTSVHQANLLFFPHDQLPRGGRFTSMPLGVVDVASRSRPQNHPARRILQKFQRLFRKFIKDH